MRGQAGGISGASIDQNRTRVEVFERGSPVPPNSYYFICM